MMIWTHSSKDGIVSQFEIDLNFKNAIALVNFNIFSWNLEICWVMPLKRLLKPFKTKIVLPGPVMINLSHLCFLCQFWLYNKIIHPFWPAIIKYIPFLVLTFFGVIGTHVNGHLVITLTQLVKCVLF